MIVESQGKNESNQGLNKEKKRKHENRKIKEDPNLKPNPT